ncbi:MAG: hypothetical protein PHI84_02205 [Kiritimatiellae bacterium]|nr:hypothetical protein [Kiritimatiellia bacterium]
MDVIFTLGFCVFLILLVILAWIMLKKAKFYFSTSKYFPAFVCGVLGMVCLVLPIILLLAPVCITDGHRSNRTQCMSNIRQIGISLSMYSVDHNERYPQDLQTLAITMKLPPRLFICPSSKHIAGSLSNLNEWTDYVYICDSSPTNDPNMPIVFEFPANHNGKGGNVLLNDGSVFWLNTKEFRKSIQKQLLNDNMTKKK